MSVRRIYESPRVTKPYSEEQWNEVLALGDQVDAELKSPATSASPWAASRLSFRSTMRTPRSGPPALSARPSVSWRELFLRLRDRFAPGALLHFGQGKWYPGEPLPRWALSCYWRKDGVPIWEDQSLFAAKPAVKYNAGDARRFPGSPDAAAGSGPSFIMAAYEDTFYYLWRERRLPVNVNPLDSKIEDPIERKRAGPHLRAGARQDHRIRASLRRRAHENRARRAGPASRGSPHRRICSWFRAIRRWVAAASRIASLGPSRRTSNIPSKPDPV
jgi:uncharacterized protein (DUF2126 family)